MAEFDPNKPARVYDNLNEDLFERDPKERRELQAMGAAAVQGQGLREGLVDYDGLELLGWYPV